MKLKVIYLGLSILASFSAGAQQESQFANSAYNPFLLNPAAGGLTNVLNIESTTRFQWTGYSGSPRTIMLSGSAPISFGGTQGMDEYNAFREPFFEAPSVSAGSKKHVIGGRIINDAIGPFMRTSVYGSYAIHLPLTKKINIGAGLGIGFSNFAINQERVLLYHEDDVTYGNFLSNSSIQNYLDANAGLVVYGDQFVVGLSMLQAINNKAVFSDIITESRFNRHYFLTAKYHVETDMDVAFEPMATIKYEPKSPISADLGARGVWQNKVWFGLQYRTSHAIIIQAGSMIVKNLYLNYSYEASTGVVANYASSSHEIQLGIYIGNNRNIKKEIENGNE